MQISDFIDEFYLVGGHSLRQNCFCKQLNCNIFPPKTPRYINGIWRHSLVGMDRRGSPRNDTIRHRFRGYGRGYPLERRKWNPEQQD